MNYSNKILLSIFIICLFSAKSASQNNPYVDERALHFGFFVGMNSADFGIRTAKTTFDGVKYAVADARLQPGFLVGVISDFRLHDYWNVRINPSLQFVERELTYKNLTSNELTRQTILSVPLCLPVYLKYSSQRVGNYKPYLIGGVGAYYDLAHNEEKPILLRPLDFYVEFGIGCDFYFSFFKLAPELKFAIGFNDVFTPLSQRKSGFFSEADRKYSDMLSHLTSRMITLVFNFE
ncbi:MAG: PorT family protein [Paludibacter sp.]|nr:PorT family protein [Paludibacter sp.]